ncbi:Peptidase family M50 [Symmachiella dynata]|uniref:Peptidase family M50 n=1 Tax=Symmachiella dynata TaxID=2527995 RepID=A0A517ZIU9_9PLAN|nr:site-2 protease family protein [Symmachiella dynata]QDU42396.1 Peptidase family M50 [Symmachiella dynata]
MNNSLSPFGWKFSIGTWFSVRVYVSVLFPLAIFYFLWLFGPAMGGMLSGLLFVSVLLHEFGHIFGARITGGFGDEILIWPLGGLAQLSPANNTRGKLIATAAGPAVNLAICLLLAPFVYHSPYLSNAFMPLVAPISRETFEAANMLDNVVLLGFHMNFALLMLNLLPACPLDGGQMLRTTLMASMGNSRGMDWSVKVGFAVALLVLLVAIINNHVLVMSLAFLFFFTAYLDMQRMKMGEYFEDSFMGYDFSQGYTSLERTEEATPQRQPGLIARWRNKRATEKRRRLEIEARENELKVDAILAKLHDKGMESLTEAEKRQLKRASSRYKDKDQSPG